MRTPYRDRCRSSLIALCASLVIALTIIIPAGALLADYQIFPNGTAYLASIEITDASQYEFSEVGILGEDAPLKVGNVELSGDCSPCGFNWSGRWGSPVILIIFERGNYTVSYTAPLQDNHLQGTFIKPYHVNVTIPGEFDVRNPLLSGISPGANITRHPDNSTTIQWNKTLSFDLRFYDQNREDLLYLFGNFWVILAIVLLLPFLITMRRSK